MYYTIKSRTPSRRCYGRGGPSWGDTNQLNCIQSPFISFQGLIPIEDVLAAGFRTFAYFSKADIKSVKSEYNQAISDRECIHDNVPFGNTILYTLTSKLIQDTAKQSKKDEHVDHELRFYINGKETNIQEIKRTCCDKCDQRVKCLYNPDGVNNFYCSPKGLAIFEETNSNIQQRIKAMFNTMGISKYKAKEKLLGREYVSIVELTDEVGFTVNEFTADKIEFDNYKKVIDPKLITKRQKVGRQAALTRKLQKEKCLTCMYKGDLESKHTKCALHWRQCWKGGWHTKYHDEAIFYKNTQYIEDITDAAIIKAGGYEQIKRWMTVCDDILVINRSQYIVALPYLTYQLKWNGQYLLIKKRVNLSNLDDTYILPIYPTDIKKYKSKGSVSGYSGYDLTKRDVRTYMQLIMLLMNKHNRNGKVTGSTYYRSTNFGDTRDILLGSVNIYNNWTFISGIARTQIAYRYSGFSVTDRLESWEDIAHILMPLNRHFISAESLTGIFINNE